MSTNGPQLQLRPRTRTSPVSRTQRFVRVLSWPNPAGILLSCTGAVLVIAGALGVSHAYPFQSTTAAPKQGSPVAVADTKPSVPEATPLAAPAPKNPANNSQASNSQASNSAASKNPASTTPTSKSPASKSPPASTTKLSAGKIVIVPTASAAPAPPPTFKASTTIQNTAINGSTDPNSIFVLVNKRNPLKPLGYGPSDLRTPRVAAAGVEAALLRDEPATAVERMFAVANAAGVQIKIQSSYRSYTTQVGLYGSYVEQKGQASSDTSSARPGYSEHQSGLTLDIGDATTAASCQFTECVASTAAGLWVAQHGAEFGFIVRYPNELERITGYLYEPWHLRYVGIEAAQDMKARGVSTYEQYLGEQAAPNY